MSIPRTKTFNNKRGFQAEANVGINSPTQTNTQSVNVILRGIPTLTKDNRFDDALNKANIEHKELDITERTVDVDTLENKPLNDPVEDTLGGPSYAGDVLKERSIETAKNSLTEMEEILKNKDNLIEALSLILDIYENNPLIVNKFIVAQEDELTKLLFLLTGAEQIELIKTDPETGCTCKFDKYTHIQKIMVKKNGTTYNFKYSFPNVVQLLDNRKISWKVVI